MSFSDGGAGALATLTVDDGVTVTQPWSGSLPAPRIDGSTATYPDVYPGVDLVLRAQTEGFEQSWVINSRPDVPLKLDIPLALKGLTVVTKPDDTVELVDAQGNLRASADPALMWDATVDPATGEPANQVSVPTNLVETGSGKYVLEVEPDRSFLDSATYPITIDPTSSLYASSDTYIDDSHPTGWFQNNTLLKAGRDGVDSTSQLQRALLAFPVDSLAGTTIQSASLNLYETWSGSCTPTTLDLFAVTSAWDGTVT